MIRFSIVLVQPLIVGSTGLSLWVEDEKGRLGVAPEPAFIESEFFGLWKRQLPQCLDHPYAEK